MSTVLKDSLSLKINNSFKDNSNIVKIQRTIKNYIDQNSEILYDSGPNLRLFFSDEEREFVFDTTGIKSNEITELIKKIDDIDERWTIVTPFNILITMMIRVSEMKKNTNLSNLMIMSLTLSLYSSLHFKYFKFLPNKQAMDYAINNMTNKYLIKKYGVLYKALEHIAMKNHETYASSLIKGNDIDIKNYIMNLRTRLNNFLKIITDEYLNSVRDKKYLNIESESRDEENYIETSNISLQMEKLVNLASNKFVSTNINSKFARVAANACTVHPGTLEMALRTLKENETYNVTDLIRRILKIYFLDKSNSFDSIKTNRFLPYMLKIYSKSNIKDEDIASMKKLLDQFLLKYCNRYTDTEREATRVSYRKALYIYMLLHVNASAMQLH